MGKDLIKVVYFDNDSAKDVSMLKNGGIVSKKEKNSNTSLNEDIKKTQTKINYVNFVFFVLYLLGAFYLTKTISLTIFSILFYPYLRKEIFSPFILEVNQMLDINLSSNSNSFNKSERHNEIEILNTDLTDFINEYKASNVIEFSEVDLKLEQNSMSFLTSYSSIFKILKTDVFDNPDNPLEFNKMEDFLNTYKGYYEAIAINKDTNEEYIFRFNRKTFKNGYDLSDLLKMDLKYFGILVGEMDKEELDISKMFKTEEEIITVEKIKETTLKQNKSLLKIYDIILAGVIKK